MSNSSKTCDVCRTESKNNNLSFHTEVKFMGRNYGDIYWEGYGVNVKDTIRITKKN